MKINKIFFLLFIILLNLNAIMQDDIVYVEDKNSSQKSLKDEFFNPNSSMYTLSVCTLDLRKYDPIEYFKTFNMTNAVAYKFGENKEYARVISGVYKTGTDATNDIKNLDPRLIKNKPYSANLKRHQELFTEYNKGYKKTSILNKKKIQQKETNKNFTKSVFIGNSKEAKRLKQEFLNENSNYYSLAIGSISLKSSSIENFFNTYNVSNEALAHLYGKNKDKARIIYGLYKSKQEALNALNNLNGKIKANKPYPRKMTNIQKFYYKSFPKNQSDNEIVELKISNKKQEKSVKPELSDEIKVVKPEQKKTVEKIEKPEVIKQVKKQIKKKKIVKKIEKKVQKKVTTPKTKSLKNQNKFIKESKLVDVYYVEENDSFNILSEVFLNDGSSFFTIDFGELDLDKTTIEQFFIENNMKSKALAYKYGDKKEYARVIYGAFETRDDAKSTIEKLNVTNLKDLKISNIKNHQKLYKVYHKNKMVYSNQVQKTTNKQYNGNEKEFTYASAYSILENSSSKLKDEFFNRDSSKYTITLITFLKDDMRVDKFFQYYNLYENSLAFPIGSENSYYRVITGVYNSFDEAKIAIENLSEELKANNPYISRIKTHQKKLESYGRVLENELTQIQKIEFK